MIHEGMLAPETARARLLQTVEKVVGTESCALEAAAGRRLGGRWWRQPICRQQQMQRSMAMQFTPIFWRHIRRMLFTVVGRAAAGHPFSATSPRARPYGFSLARSCQTGRMRWPCTNNVAPMRQAERSRLHQTEARQQQPASR